MVRAMIMICPGEPRWGLFDQFCTLTPGLTRPGLSNRAPLGQGHIGGVAGAGRATKQDSLIAGLTKS
jgi:hypothetical protein